MLSTPGKSSCPCLLSFYPQFSPLSSSKPSSGFQPAHDPSWASSSRVHTPSLALSLPRRLSIKHASLYSYIYTCQVSPLLIKSTWAGSAAPFRGPTGGQAGEQPILQTFMNTDLQDCTPDLMSKALQTVLQSSPGFSPAKFGDHWGIWLSAPHLSLISYLRGTPSTHFVLPFENVTFYLLGGFIFPKEMVYFHGRASNESKGQNFE